MVLSHQKISDTEGGFTGILDNSDIFGSSVASLGDLDGDGVGDLAVGATGDDDGGPPHGAVWVLFLNTDGTVKS
ncbi:MAG: FG-GAP repeat protein, partial [Planctomycetes bacterium]|nr:FG-GAP repeat protein [Planctomycetota bacterium]